MYNLKLMEEEMGVVVEMVMGLEGEVNEEKVKRIVEMVLEREEGSKGWEMKNRVVEMGKKFKDLVREEIEYKGFVIKVMDDFVDVIIFVRERKLVELLGS